MIPTDVPKDITDRYRLFLVLRNSSKPVVTGTFTLDGFDVMNEMLLAIRGSKEALKERPLAIFDVCPSPPLKWSNLTCHDLIECAKAGIPAEFISMPMTGASAPVTLAGAVVQHTAETLSGVVIGQLAQPGAPLIYGGSPTAFDMRKGTPPMGAIETMMIDCAYVQIGKHLGVPTQAYMGLSDAKLPDSQAGLESGIGAILAALGGVDLVAGPGMLTFESCQSPEKLVIDNEICGMAKRLIEGINPRTDRLAEDLFHGDIYQGDHFLTSPTTMKWFRKEFFQPGSVIDRDDKDVWIQKGATTAEDKAHQEVKRILASHTPLPLSGEIDRELMRIMEQDAKKYGLERLP
jgi:trimethylamine--corrinoid protein Co-methyltransferase